MCQDCCASWTMPALATRVKKAPTVTPTPSLGITYVPVRLDTWELPVTRISTSAHWVKVLPANLQTVFLFCAPEIRLIGNPVSGIFQNYFSKPRDYFNPLVTVVSKVPFHCACYCSKKSPKGCCHIIGLASSNDTETA